MTPSNYSAAQQRLHDIALFLGRALIALLFIPSGVDKLLAFTATSRHIAMRGLPAPDACTVAAIAAELGCGLLLLAGVRTRWAALGLAVFTAVVTPIFHPYWSLPDQMLRTHSAMFWKNAAIVGGLLLVAACGAGALSLDALLKRRK